jgi:hypothetical protein
MPVRDEKERSRVRRRDQPQKGREAKGKKRRKGKKENYEILR